MRSTPTIPEPRSTRRRWNRVLSSLILISTLLASCRPDRLPPAPGEVDRPLLAQSDFVQPQPDAIRLDVATTIEVRFNEAMDPRSFENHLLLKIPDGAVLSGSYSAHESAIRFTPAATLDPARLHLIELRGRVRDANGNSIERNGQPVLDDTTLIFNSWFFTSGLYDQGTPTSFALDTRGRIWTIDGFVTAGDRITEGLGAAPKGLARSNDKIISLNPAARQAVIYDASSGSLAATVAVPQDPLSVTTRGTDAFVVSGRGQTITRIDVPAGTASQQIRLNFFPAAIAVSTDGSRLYTLDQTTGDLAVIDAASGQVSKPSARLIRIPVTGEIGIDPNGGNVVVADTRNARLLVLNPDGTGPIRTFDAAIAPDGIWRPFKLAFSGDNLYVVSQNSAELHLLDLGAGTIIQTYTFENPVKGMEVLAGGNPLLVLSGARLFLVDAETGSILRMVDLPDSNAESVITVN